MRESRRTEKMHLPKDTTEAWLDAQKPSMKGTRHRKPPEDSMEAWIKKRVSKTLERRKPAA